MEIRVRVAIPPKGLDRNGVVSQSSVVKCLLKELLLLKSTEEHGYFLGVTKLKAIGNGEFEEKSRDILFSVSFNCRTFPPVTGEIMLGVVHKTHRRGCLPEMWAMKFGYFSKAKTFRMFLKIQLPWNVIIPAESLDTKGLMLQKSIITRLLDGFSTKKATKELGYFLAVTILDHIGEGRVRQHTGDVLFPVLFSCVTFKPFRGEILGVVHKILKHGVFSRCRPIENIYISNQKMSDYKYVPGENPIIMNDKMSRIKKGVAVRFSVIGTKYIETEKEFQAVVSLEGDFHGPVSE